MHLSSLIITGASSGIGAALARAYAVPGITLGLLGRNEARLSEVADVCKAQGATVVTGSIDVRDSASVAQWIEAFDTAHPVSLFIANAGIAATLSGEGGESAQQVRDIFAVNVDGVLNTVLPIIPRMQVRRAGQIAVMSSLAGIRGLPSCPAYSASKNAVRALGEGLRGSLKRDGIDVSVICPGFIRTPLTDANSFPMPFLMQPDKAASIIMNGLAKNRGRIAFPLALYLPLWLTTCLPQWLTDPFFAALPQKNAKNAV